MTAHAMLWLELTTIHHIWLCYSNKDKNLPAGGITASLHGNTITKQFGESPIIALVPSMVVYIVRHLEQELMKAYIE